MPSARPGVVMSPEIPTKDQLVRAARLILDNCGIAFGQNKIVRLVLRFKDRAPNANGQLFFQYLTNAVQMTHEQQVAALQNPDIAKVCAHPDPVGEHVANLVGNRLPSPNTLGDFLSRRHH